MFSQEKGGQLKSAKLEVEDYLQKTYSDLEKKGNLGLPPDMPPFGKVAHEMDIRASQWKEVQEVVKHANPSSAPRPNGVPYWLHKSAPEIPNFLWRQIRIVWNKQIIPRSWHRAGGVLIPKEKASGHSRL